MPEPVTDSAVDAVADSVSVTRSVTGSGSDAADDAVDTVTEVPVAVVGAGPAGLMLAHRLGRAGWTRWRSTCAPGPRSRAPTGRASWRRARPVTWWRPG
ncbi:FAD-dependent monooxygenase [Kitasatospora fiedleri]|uniref:FAD-dependent monooxygenase n=1 Tax=Kitasatospora fiedleri TaxID=2991545 RepID=UPI00249A9FCB|nr:FAD-dependent monooxygenase [Kitasatospora fiedleri]